MFRGEECWPWAEKQGGTWHIISFPGSPCEIQPMVTRLCTGSNDLSCLPQPLAALCHRGFASACAILGACPCTGSLCQPRAAPLPTLLPSARPWDGEVCGWQCALALAEDPLPWAGSRAGCQCWVRAPQQPRAAAGLGRTLGYGVRDGGIGPLPLPETFLFPLLSQADLLQRKAEEGAVVQVPGSPPPPPAPMSWAPR